MIYDNKFPVNDEIKSYIGRIQGGQDHYALSRDFASYCDAQERADAVYRDQMEWARMAITNVARSAKFSSDRTI